MKIFFTLVSFLVVSSFLSQTQISNASFENWENLGQNTEEPTSWNSNKTGTGLADNGPQTCYRDAGRTGYCVRVETKYYVLAVVNGVVTTGLVNAPSANKSEGYLGATSPQKMNFTGRPDSLVGWYKYTQATTGSGAASETGKIRAILHTSDYYDPETPYNNNHPNQSANKIGEAVFYTAAANNTVWKRFSVPFSYVNGSTPSFIMINISSSSNQLTTAPGVSGSGSKLWADDLQAIYNPPVANFNISATRCPSIPISFTDVSTKSPTSWSWSFPGGNPSTSTLQNPSVTYTQSGVYNVTLIATNPNGGSSAPVVRTITVNPRPTITINSPTSCVAGQPLILTASGVLTYTWGNNAHTSTISVNPTSNTSYIVLGTNALGCVNVASNTVIVAPVNLTVNSATICVGTSTVLSVSGASTYTWNNNSHASAITVSPIINTNYTVVGRNIYGCSNTKTISVVVSSVSLTVNSPTSCPGAVVTLSANATSYPAFSYTYTWFNNTHLSTTTSTPNITTSYTVRAINTLGCLKTNTVTATVYTVNLNVNAATICSGGTATLIAFGASTYSWSTGATSSVIVVNPLSTTNYTVRGVNSAGCARTVTTSVTINANPSITTNAPPAICMGQTVSITASGVSSYTWSTNSNNATIIVSPTTSTTYTILGQAAGCVPIYSTVINVLVNNNPTVSLTSISSTLCEGGNSVLLNGTPIGGIYSGLGVTTDSFNPSSAGTYTLSYLYTDGNNCSGSSSHTIIVNSLPFVYLDPIPSPPCEGDAVIVLNGVPSGGIYSGLSVTTDSFNPSTSGTYTVSYSYTDINSCTASSDQIIIVNAKPSLSLTSSSYVLCEGDAPAILNGLPSGGVYSGLGVLNNSFDPFLTGTYTVTYSYIDTNNCSASIDQSISVNACTGISEMEINKFSLYPNPVNNILFLNLSNISGLIKTIEIFDVNAQKIMTLNSNDSEIRINTNEFAVGVYIIKINVNNSKPLITRFIKN